MITIKGLARLLKLMMRSCDSFSLSLLYTFVRSSLEIRVGNSKILCSTIVCSYAGDLFLCLKVSAHLLCLRENLKLSLCPASGVIF